MSPWLSIIGIGEDGLDALSPAARRLIAQAEVLVGGRRHLDMVPGADAERLTWAVPLTETVAAIAQRRGRQVAVLATGDPMWFGIGVTLARRFAREEMTIIPGIGAFTLAAARLGWPLADVEALTLHGRPLDLLALHLAPEARLLILSADGTTPAEVAAWLTARGWGPSALTVLEHMGGTAERRLDGSAEGWPHGRVADLNLLAVTCRATPRARVLSRAPGLPDDAFLHDGQITKREIRAATLAALCPLPGQLLWDIGAGSGSIAIEWLRAARGTHAVAIERDPGRATLIARNAAALGVPRLAIVEGAAPAALSGLALPDAVFIGGGITAEGLVATAWEALKPGGRLVGNVVTLEGEKALVDVHARLGGYLIRFAIARAEPVGSLTGWRPLMPVTQWSAVK